MTDNEIIKALECCAQIQKRCSECPAWKELNLCGSVVKSQALKLINRQKEEIDVWRSAYDVAYSTNTELYGALKTARAETAKEFAEGLKETAMGKVAWDEYDDAIYGFVTVDEIDNRLKEFTEETK